MHGESYKLFIQNKLVPVVGNIYEPNLGMDIITTQQIAQEIDLIVNSAAITTFDESLTCTFGKSSIQNVHLIYNIELSQFFLFKAYANGEREGLILEKPFTMGESITKEKTTSVSPFINFPSLYADNEIDLVSKLKNNVNNNGLEQLMKDLGAERAKLYGWEDTYSFTKSIGEMMINNMRGEIPILILRPSIIASSYKDPFSGWKQGLRVLDSLIVFYRKGDLSGFLGDPDCHVVGSYTSPIDLTFIVAPIIFELDNHLI
ncbi:hypothetical protein RDI58_015603 [Solanum bulbocastanum]|uniref:Fatty acyl-CoA reductase n=1 Tax=Solanum bulbocastanum TaxID=147425 RepID=A0AAN8YF54_SOLBU